MNGNIAIPVKMIVAIDEAGGIGDNSNSGIPWNLPEDMQLFSKLTCNHICIVGRSTYEHIRSPKRDYLLPERHCVVLTSKPSLYRQRENSNHKHGMLATSFVDDNSGHFLSLIEFLSQNGTIIPNKFDFHEHKGIFVIGGAKVYREYMNSGVQFTDVYVSRVKGVHECTTHLPQLDGWLNSRMNLETRVSYDGFDAERWVG